MPIPQPLIQFIKDYVLSARVLDIALISTFIMMGPGIVTMMVGMAVALKALYDIKQNWKDPLPYIRLASYIALMVSFTVPGVMLFGTVPLATVLVVAAVTGFVATLLPPAIQAVQKFIAERRSPDHFAVSPDPASPAAAAVPAPDGGPPLVRLDDTSSSCTSDTDDDKDASPSSFRSATG